MYAGIWEIDLHGKNEYQARVTLDAALRRVRPGLDIMDSAIMEQINS